MSENKLTDKKEKRKKEKKKKKKKTETYCVSNWITSLYVNNDCHSVYKQSTRTQSCKTYTKTKARLCDSKHGA